MGTCTREKAKISTSILFGIGSLLIFMLLFFFQSAHAANVTLAWDPVVHPNLSGYTVYCGPSSGTYTTSTKVGNQTTYTVTGIAEGTTCYFSVTASDTSGNESGYSNEVRFDAPVGGGSSGSNGTVVFAVNAGGPQYVDGSGVIFQADTLFSGGATFSTTNAIAGTVDDVLYQSERYGNFSYTVPVADGDYQVTLKFSENWWWGSGDRIFNVTIEGVQVIQNLDIYAQVGRLTAYDVTIPVRVTDGTLNIAFTTVKDSAKVSAFLVRSAAASSSPSVNNPPSVVNDSAQTDEDVPVVISVLANDSDPDGDSLAIVSVTQPSHGAAIINGGAITYSPAADYNGADTFGYTVKDSNGATATGVVTVTIRPVNDPPTATGFTLETETDCPVSGTLMGSDADGDPLTYTITSACSMGSVKIINASTGAFTYTPNPSACGTDAFGFRVSDGKETSNQATVTITVSQPTDSDKDGIPDSEETSVYHTDPNNPDTDGDGLNDGDELAYWKNDWNMDLDGDGKINLLDLDSDNDGFSDGIEIAQGFNPADPDEPVVVFAVNSGGQQYVDAKGLVYKADTLYAGGGTYVGASSIAGTNDAPLYQSERNGIFSYAVPVDNGNYIVKLKFAEILLTAAGQRIFDVEAEGYPVVTDLDIYAAVGGNRAYDLEVPATVTDGVLELNFFPLKGDAKIGAIVVAGKPQQSDSGGNGFTPLGINAGGPQYVSKNGINYQADIFYSGGKTSSKIKAVANTDDDPLYQSERFGNFSYAIPVPNGNFLVTLKFAELQWGGSGRRIFDVDIEGVPVIKRLDIYAKVGRYAAYDVPVPVTVSDGTLNITFRSVKDSAKVSAILVEGR